MGIGTLDGRGRTADPFAPLRDDEGRTPGHTRLDWLAGAGRSILCALLLAGTSFAQGPQPQPMGSVATKDAQVTGGLEVSGDIARLINNASVTASDRPAPVALSRGGHVLVCSTSEFHLLHSGANGALIFGLNRGAIELYSESQPGDVVLTPDLKLTPVTRGSLDLRVRVTRDGDTCVENAGTSSPVLNATDAFSSTNYRVLPGQHLLFVNGDLHRVVDHERSPCGCPAGLPPILVGKNGKPIMNAATAHPFPQADSEGLTTPGAPANEAPVGVASSQVSTTFSYNDGRGTPPPGTTANPAPESTSATQAPLPAQRGFGNALKRFFHKLFHPGS